MIRICFLNDIRDVRGHLDINLESVEDMVNRHTSSEIIAEFGEEEIAGVNITGNGYATGMVEAPDVHALGRHAWWRNLDDYRVRYIDETRVVFNADTGDPVLPRDVEDADDYSVNSHDDGSAAASAAATS
jgi:hypothetical protein